jgi:hypothetical protein
MQDGQVRIALILVSLQSVFNHTLTLLAKVIIRPSGRKDEEGKGDAQTQTSYLTLSWKIIPGVIYHAHIKESV